MLPHRSFITKYLYSITFVSLFNIISVDGNTNNRGKRTEKRILRCVVQNSPSFEIITRDCNGTLSLRGGTKTAQLWHENLDLIIPDIEQTKLRGQEAVVDLVVGKEADYVGGGLIPSPTRLEVVESDSYIVCWEDSYRFTVLIPEEENSLLAFIWQFDSAVWQLLFLSLIVTVVTLSVISWIYHRLLPGDLNNENF